MRISIALASLALLAACNDTAPQPEPAAEQSDAPSTPAASRPADAASGDRAVPAAAEIPAALQGRWGLVSADCTSTRGDNKGLLEVGPETLRFYESRGTLGEVTASQPDLVRATFAFTGEGMEWTREMQLRLIGGKDRLERTEYGPEAAAELLLYERCPT